MTHERAYIGSLRWRARLRPFFIALGDAWRALRGWERTIICHQDEEEGPAPAGR